jgi:hypothetical protein
MTVPASSYNGLIPQPGDLLFISQDDLLLNFGAIQTLIDVNHVDFGASGAGKHYFVQFPVQVAAPVTVGSEVGLYSQTSAYTSQPELVFEKQLGSSAPVTSYEVSSAGYASTGWSRFMSGVLLKWGSATAAAPGALVVTYPAGAAIPAFVAIYSGQITPTSNVSAYISAISATQLTITFSAAGTCNYLVLGV